LWRYLLGGIIRGNPRSRMSQSATLYRVSRKTFNELKNAAGHPEFDPDQAKESLCVDWLHMGLEYILSKDSDKSAISLAQSIFNPPESLGGGPQTSGSQKDNWDLTDPFSQIAYLSPSMTMKLSQWLETIREREIRDRYDADEFNENDVYPCGWENNNSPNLACTERSLVEAFKKLKAIIKKAAKNEDYLLVFVG
jgi:hypothetical protein